MQKSIYNILLLVISFGLNAQEPAHKTYTYPKSIYYYVEYANDSLYVSTDEVKLYSFNGIDFKEVRSPQSKYLFKDLHFLKKGYFMRNTVRHYWYRPVSGDWGSIRTPQSNIVFKDTLFGFSSDSILYFDEDMVQWQFYDMINNENVSLETHHPYLFCGAKGDLLSLRNKKHHNELYDIKNDSLIFLPNDFNECKGEILNEKIFFNGNSGDINWKYLKNSSQDLYDILKMSPTPEIKFDIRFDSKSAVSTNLVEQDNRLCFFSIDSSSGINYAGEFSMPRANYKKIREDLYFIGGFEGVVKVNPNIMFYTPQNSNINKNVRSIVEHNGYIWTGGYGSGFSRMDTNMVFSSGNSDFMRGTYNNILNGGFALSDNEAWFFNEGYNTIFILKDNIVQGYQLYSNGKRSWAKGYYIDTLNDGRLAFSLQYDNFGILDSVVDHRVYITSLADKYGLKHGNTWKFDQDLNDRVWLCRFTAGMAVYDINMNKVISFPFDLNDANSFGVLSVFIDSFDNMWLGTTKGLFLLKNVSKFDIYNKSIYDEAIHIDLPNGDNSLVAAIEGIDDYIVLGNGTGISFIKYLDYNKFDIDKTPIHQLIYGEDINGRGTEQNCIYYDKNKYLWISTIDGVLKINPGAIHFDTSGVELVFDYIKNADNTLTEIDNKIEISPVKRNLILKFAPKFNPGYCDNIYYDYTLVNNKGDTVLLQKRNKKNSLSIDYLSPGRYSFVVHASKNGMLKDTLKMDIFVPYTFGENPWIWGALLILLSFLLSGFIYYRKEKIKQLSKKELALAKVRAEKENLKVQTVLSTFNPHFISNSLHWVQSRYYKDKDLTKMVGRLSDNIAYILKKTRQGNVIHNLEEELGLVNNYVTIQQLRFENSFEYIPPAKSIVDKYKNVELILLQIQIHVENAIEHGIRNREGSKFVKVEINESRKAYTITITDDGAGRTVARQMGSNGSGSGIKMLKELRRIFNRNPLNKTPMTSKYQDDIYEKDGTKYGTKVIITIPKGYVYEIDI